MNSLNDSESNSDNINASQSEPLPLVNSMITKKRKRVVNLLVRNVGSPIQHSYVVILLNEVNFNCLIL